MSAEILLARLDGAKETRPNQWLARCPAHDDRSPSLSIREASDGAVLVHCHSGCTTEAVMSAVGLGLKDLYPSNNFNTKERWNYRKQMNRRGIEKELLHELWVLLQTVSARVNEREYPRDYWDREKTAAKRIVKALEVLYG